MDYVFSDKSKKITLGVGVIGLLLFVLGIAFDGNDYASLVTADGHNYGASNRIWVSLLTNGIFFFFISLAVYSLLHYNMQQKSLGLLYSREFMKQCYQDYH